MNNELNKNMFWNMIGSLTYVFASMIFLVIVVRINDQSAAGAFSIAFSISSILLCIGNYATRTFQVTENYISDKAFLAHRHFVTTIMFVISMIYAFISDYSIFKLNILILFMIYKIFEAYSEILYAIIQKHDELYKAGKSLFMKGLFGISLFFIVDLITKNLFISLISLLIITLLIIIFYDLKIVRSYNMKKEKVSFNEIKLIFKKGFNPFLFSFLGLYMMSAPRFGIDQFLTDDYQAIFGILMMPATIVIVLSQFLIQPYLNTLKNYVKTNKFKDFKTTVNSVLIKIAGLGFFLIVSSYFFGDMILKMIYGLDVSEYKLSITLIIIGAVMCGITYIISATLTTLRKLTVQSILYITASVIAFILTNYLVFNYHIMGASIAYVISMTLLSSSYIIYYMITINKKHKKNTTTK